MQLDVEKCRGQFPGLGRQTDGRPAVFFDGPAGSQVPQVVIDAVSDCLAHHNANDGGLFVTSREVGELADSARAALASLLHCENDPDSVIFGPNMTTLSFALGRALAKTWRPGDEVIVTRLDHDANVAPWVQAAADAGATVRYVDVDPADCTLRLDQFAEFLNERTRFVAIGVASNAVGTINPVGQIVKQAHRAGAMVFVDAVHAAPHLLLDVAGWDCDFLACSAYKFFGPHLGILWGRRTLLEQLPACKVRPAPDTLPGKWMTGTPCFEAIAGARAAVTYLANINNNIPARRASEESTNIPARRASEDSAVPARSALTAAFQIIRTHETNLAHRFLNGLSQLPSYRLWGIGDLQKLEARVPTFGLTHRRHTPAELAGKLGERGIFTWHGNFYALGLVEALGLHPTGLLRIGFLHYNTVEEVDRLLTALADIDQTFLA